MMIIRILYHSWKSIIVVVETTTCEHFNQKIIVKKNWDFRVRVTGASYYNEIFYH
jgi:hypothetical protein